MKNMNMKFIASALVLMLILVVSASATVTLQTPSSVLLGNDQTRSGTTVSTPVQVTNAGNETLTDLTYRTLADSQYSLSLSGLPASLGAGQSVTATLSGFIPNGFSGLRSIGTLVIGNATMNNSIPISMQTQTPLQIKRVRFDIDGKGDSARDGETIDISARPGSKVTIRAEIENTFSRDSRVDIEDIDVTLAVEEVDDGDDFETDDTFDLSPEKEKEISLTFTIPLNTEEGTYTVSVDADGRDENGTVQRAQAEVFFEVEKERHDVRVTRFAVTPSVVDCSPRQIVMSIELTNYGQDQEDHVSLGIRQPVLGIEVNQFNIELDNDLDSSDSRYRRDIRYTIPDSVKPGTYQIELNAFNDNDFSAFQVADVKVEACADTATTSPPPIVSPPVVSPPPSSGSSSNGNTPAEAVTPGTKAQVSSTNWTLILVLGAVNLIVLILIIVIVSRLLMK